MSGVSFGKSEFSVKAGLLSAPDASDKAISSNGRRGVVNAGFLNGGAGCTTGILGVKNDEEGADTWCLEGVVGIWVFGSERCGACFAGDEKMLLFLGLFRAMCVKGLVMSTGPVP